MIPRERALVSAEKLGFTLPLRDLLIEAALSPDAALRKGVEAIDLGVIGREAEWLLDLTLGDPEKKERGKRLICTPDRRLWIDNLPFMGTELVKKGKVIMLTLQFPHLDVHLSLSPNIDRSMQQDKYFGGMIHTHPFVTPVSAPDITYLLKSPQSPEVCPMGFIINPERKYLFFRSSQTPSATNQDINELSEIMAQGVENFFDKFFLELAKKNNKVRLGEKTLSSLQALCVIELMKYHNSIHHFKIYSCKVGENIATLEPPGYLFTGN